MTEPEKIILRIENIGLRELQLRYIANKWESKLNRPLFAYEWDILKFPKSCTFCSSRYVKSGCDNCLSVFYCSNEHQEEHLEQHDKFCSLLKLNMDLLVYKYKIKIPSLRLNESFPEDLKQLSKDLPEMIDLLVKNQCIYDLNKTERPLEYILYTDQISPATNIFYSLEKVGFLKNRMYKKKLVNCHIVGADAEETTWDWRLIIQFIFHCIKNLKRIVLEVVEPGVHNFFCQKLDQSTFCGNCNLTLKSACCSFRPHYYHEIVEDLVTPEYHTIVEFLSFQLGNIVYLA